ncbi:hypothetical protein SteCoe_28416 [Stentor coeruleus]|uniref:ceramidase n=1 Tax=Stentor coeruleus TaxID=5963 RepID=A0A1R2B8B1_9CILI|nr:hypothetical protein SteCoe_28416 [Stentor coeruleus]
MIITFIVLLIAIHAVEEIPLPTFDIDLDQSPETRWNHVLDAKRTELKKFVLNIEAEYNPFLIKYVANGLIKSGVFSQEIIQEMKSGSEYLNLNFQSVVFGNFMNEFFALCSSLVIRKPQGGIILGRNFDSNYPNSMRELSVDLSFYKSGKLLYKSTSIAMYYGIVTGMRPEAYAISLNQRNLHDHSYFWETLGLIEGSKSASFAIRYVLENIDNYDDAKDYLENIPILSGEYICIAGITDGAVITRNRKYVADLKELDEVTWYIVQTNYDHWLQQPENDDRYNPNIDKLELIGKEYVDEDQVHRLMTMKPTLNSDTVHTTIMNPLTGYWYAVTWPLE